MTKNSQRQGMAELLAQQRAGRPLTPSEAARERRSGRPGSAPDSAGTGHPAGRPVAGSQPPQDLPPAEEALAQERQATRDQPAEAGEAPATTADVNAPTKASHVWVTGRARGRAAGRPRSARSAAGHAGQVKDHASAAAGNVNQAVPGPIRRAVSRATSSKATLLAAACAAAVPLACWLMARRRRQALAQGAGPDVRTQLRDKAIDVTGKVSSRAAAAARSAWPARRP